MKIQYLYVRDLVPTQSVVKLRNFKEKFGNFNPDYFDPITFCRAGAHNLIAEGHHRSVLFYIASQAFNSDFKIPSRLDRRVKGNSMFEYANRAANSLSEISLEVSGELSSPLSEIFTRDQDVYARLNGSNQYLFTLPDLQVFREISEKYNLNLV